MRLLGLSAIVVPVLTFGQSPTVRLWFAYGDEASAQRARASSVDSNAQVGREIIGNRLAVPTNGKDFKVQLWCELRNSPVASVYQSAASVNLAFDRTLCSDSGRNPVLNASSFRKVRPAGANQNDMIEAFTNGAVVPAWSNASNMSDEDGNGVQDIAQISYLQTLPSAWRQGTQGAGVSLRPVGLATYLTGRLLTPPEYAGGSVGYKIPNATPFRIIDVNWVSMLNLGETYGDRPGETGLSITTSQQIGLANTTAIVGSASHTGSRYTLVAVVPEPASAVGLGLAALVLLRRKAGVH